MKKTKIICTIGPASEDKETLEKLINAGMNVARINFSHGDHEEHLGKIKNIKAVRDKLKQPIAIMLDTKGPEYRIKTFDGGRVSLKEGDEFTFTSRNVVGNEKQVSVTYKNLAKDLNVGDKILLCNGLMYFEVVKLTDTDAVCKVLVGGELSDKKSMNFPNKVMSDKYLSNQDKKDILFGIENDVDYVAASFVSRKQDVIDIRKFLDKNGGENIDIIAKIENQTGVDNIDEILEACEGIMIGRGDMGVEIPFEKLPKIQKYLIERCLKLGKIVITATEMLESMIKNPRPTRAETSDVANAIYDGSTAIMLSGETAMGKYPVLAVETMAKIAEETENCINYAKRFNNFEVEKHSNLDAVSRATVRLAIDTEAKVIVACTKSGRTAKKVARFRSPINILGLVTNKKMYQKLSLAWGVKPMVTEDYKTLDRLFDEATILAKAEYGLQVGDNIIITGGTGKMVNTNLVKIETIV